MLAPFVAFIFAAVLATAASHAAALIPAGVARIDISPSKPVPLMGYAARAKLPAAADVAAPIHARALAIGGDADVAIVVTIDNCILPGAVTEQVRQRLGKKIHVPVERIALTVTHTHSAPCLTGAAPNIFGVEIAAADQAAIDAYTHFLIDQLEQVALAAFADRKPSQIAWGKGSARFAKNRRTADGPVDHEMPLLRISSPEGALRAVFVSYACHCTTLGGEFNAVHGDWAGMAAGAIERDHPGAIGLVAIGCGADANPDPRGTVELAIRHGEEIAQEASRVLDTKLTLLTSAPRCRLKTVQLPFQAPFSRAEWEQRATNSGIVGYHARKWLGRLDRGETAPTTLPYPVQTWIFGDQLALVFLGGEVVVDYSLRLKRELDTNRLWINAYANDVPCYIPSQRILGEGGYEAELSLWYYDRPQRLAPETEDLIVRTVRELVPESFVVDPRQVESPPPKTPADASQTFRSRRGFEIELVASEPLIESPVAIDFAADGGLWVCEMRDYPSGMDGKGKPGGRIKLLRDSNNDGRYDSAEVWADDLPFPTGIMAWHDGVIVCAAPDLWFLSPSAGSRVSAGHMPTRREKIASGFATENFQARVSGLRWGLDGWVYGSGGLFGGKITARKMGKVIDCSNRDFRFRPDTGEFEPLAGVSQQGHVRDDFDEWFGNENSTLLWYFPLPDRYRRRNPYFAAPAPRVARSRDADPTRVYPVSRTLTRFNSPESANRITSGCGPEIYRDDLFGSAFAGNAFVCEPVHNLVRRALLQPDGVTFATRRADDEQASEFLASTDNWFRPVEVRTGPDGALWIVDMSRFVIEHPRWIPPDRLKELDVRAGASQGRIWRVFPTDTKPRPIRNLVQLSVSELARVIDGPSGVERDLAHRLLLERSSDAAERRTETIGELKRFVGTSTRAASRAQALALLSQIDGLSDEILAAALRDDDPRVRRFAVSLCEPRQSLSRVTASKGRALAMLVPLVDDPDPGVRYQLALTLGEFTSDGVGDALAKLVLRDSASEWHRAAILSSALGAPRAFARRMVALDRQDNAVETVRAALLATLVSARATDALTDWITSAFSPDAANLTGPAIAEGFRLLAALSETPDLARDLNSFSPIAGCLKRLEGELGNSAAHVAADAQAPEATRLAALHLLRERARIDPARRAELTTMLDIDLPDALRRSLMEALQKQDADDVASTLLGDWGRRSPAQRGALLAVLLSRDNWSASLLNAVERGDVAPAELSPLHRQQLRQHADGALRARAEKLFPAGRSDRAAVVKGFINVAELRGTAAKGATHFDRLCASCHALRGHGHAVGPDLAPFRVKPLADFLTAIFDPNAAIEPRYVAWNAELKGGRSVMGVVRDESSAAVTIAQPGGLVESVPRAEIVGWHPLAVSLMPEGLEQGLTPQDLADLIAWIKASPAMFGSATPAQAAAAKQQFLADAPSQISKLTCSHEALTYPSWLGALPLFYCRETDGQSRVKWEATPCAVEHSSALLFRFPVAMGYSSEPRGSFILQINGKKEFEFDVALDDAEWAQTGLRMRYLVQERNDEDSCGVLELELAAASVPSSAPTVFEVIGSATKSQRWFGIYDIR